MVSGLQLNSQKKRAKFLKNTEKWRERVSFQDEDRYFIADALHQVMEHMEASLRCSAAECFEDRKETVDFRPSNTWQPSFDIVFLRFDGRDG